MALLTTEQRKKRFEYLGLGKYNKENILKFQKKAFPNDKDEQDSKYGIHTDRALRTFYNVKKYGGGYFEPEEFTCKCGHCCGYPTYMKKVQIQHLARIRKHYKKPMHITSGMRCPYENSKSGGVSNSGHLRGYATDFYMKDVTETAKERIKALKWIKKQPNHEFTYGAKMKDSDGTYRTASGMGNAMHTETHKPKTTFTDKMFSACKKQAKWMQNYKYRWQSHPTVPKSKFYGTCVTYVACVGQRVKLIPSGKYIWHNSKGKVVGATDNFEIIYPKNKKLRDLKSVLKAGDFVMDGDKTDVEGGSHIFIVTGEWKNGCPIVWDNHSAQQKKMAYKYTRNRPVIAIARPKVR